MKFQCSYDLLSNGPDQGILFLSEYLQLYVLRQKYNGNNYLYKNADL